MDVMLYGKCTLVMEYIPLDLVGLSGTLGSRPFLSTTRKAADREVGAAEPVMVH